LRLSMGYSRLMALALALATASPVNLPAWPSDCNNTERESAAAADPVPHPGSVLAKARPLPSWHGPGGMITADPSDEPDEGADGWLRQPSLVGFYLRDLPLSIAGCGLPGSSGIADLGAPHHAGISCQLRC
jgi:hypothetical protein